MHKGLILLMILLLSLLLVVSCGKKGKDMSEMAMEEAPAAEEAMSDADEMTELVAMPGADAGELWNFITETSPYTEWSFWPDYECYQPGKSPH